MKPAAKKGTSVGFGGRCKVFSTTGLPAFPVDAPGSHNDYSKYAESFPSEAMAEATVDANYAKQFL